MILLKSLQKFEQNLLRDFASSSFQIGIISQTKRIMKAMLSWVEFSKFFHYTLHLLTKRTKNI